MWLTIIKTSNNIIQSILDFKHYQEARSLEVKEKSIMFERTAGCDRPRFEKQCCSQNWKCDFSRYCFIFLIELFWNCTWFCWNRSLKIHKNKSEFTSARCQSCRALLFTRNSLRFEKAHTHKDIGSSIIFISTLDCTCTKLKLIIVFVQV